MDKKFSICNFFKKMLLTYLSFYFVFLISDRLLEIGLESDLEILNNYFLIRERIKQLMDVAEKSNLFNESEIKLADITFRGNKLKLSKSSFNYEAIYLYFNETVYQENFKGISPFDRCLLNKILREINRLENKPKSIVIDIDLTPLDLNRFETDKKSAQVRTTQGLYLVKNYYQKCESLLYETLADIARSGVIVILPAGNYVDLREGFKRYMEQKHYNIKFASWILPKNSNFVLNYLLFDNNSNQTDKNSLYTIGYFLFNNFTNTTIEETEEVPLFFDKIEVYSIRNLTSEIGNNTVLFLGSSIRDLHLIPIIYGSRTYMTGVQLHAIGFLSILNYYEKMKNLERSGLKWIYKIINFLSEKLFFKVIIISLIFNNFYKYLSEKKFFKDKIINFCKCLPKTDFFKILNKIKLFLKRFTESMISLAISVNNKIPFHEDLTHFLQTIKQTISVILTIVIKVVLLIFIINFFLFFQKFLFDMALIDFKFSEFLLVVLISILYEIYKIFNNKPNQNQEISDQKLTA